MGPNTGLGKDTIYGSIFSFFFNDVLNNPPAMALPAFLFNIYRSPLEINRTCLQHKYHENSGGYSPGKGLNCFPFDWDFVGARSLLSLDAIPNVSQWH